MEAIKTWRDDRAAVIAELLKAAPKTRADKVAMYADAYADYRTAQANIEEHGPVVLHPRTSAPIDNPYLKIRDAARKALLSMHLRADALWSDLE